MGELSWQHRYYALLAENERLQEKNARQCVYVQRALDVASEAVALRRALQALVNATVYDDSLTFSQVWAKHDAARAAALRLLGGDE